MRHRPGITHPAQAHIQTYHQPMEHSFASCALSSPTHCYMLLQMIIIIAASNYTTSSSKPSHPRPTQFKRKMYNYMRQKSNVTLLPPYSMDLPWRCLCHLIPLVQLYSSLPMPRHIVLPHRNLHDEQQWQQRRRRHMSASNGI